MESTSVYTVIGSRVDTETIRRKLEWGCFGPAEQVALDCKLQFVDAGDYSFVCTKVHEFQIANAHFVNYGPLVIYQESDWRKPAVKEFLEKVDLWEDGSFGVWVFTVAD